MSDLGKEQDKLAKISAHTKNSNLVTFKLLSDVRRDKAHLTIPVTCVGSSEFLPITSVCDESLTVKLCNTLRVQFLVINELCIIDLGSVYRIRCRHTNLHENTDSKSTICHVHSSGFGYFYIRFSFFIVD